MLNCNYYLSFNAEPSDFVYLIETKLFTDEELEAGWGYCTPMNWENRLEDLLYYNVVDDEGIKSEEDFYESEYCHDYCDGGTAIKGSYPKFKELKKHFLDSNIAGLYDFTGIANAGDMTKEEFEKTEISKEQFSKLLETDSEFFMTICEMDPSG